MKSDQIRTLLERTLELDDRVTCLERANVLHDKIFDRQEEQLKKLKAKLIKRCNAEYNMPSDIPALKCYLEVGHTGPCKWILD